MKIASPTLAYNNRPFAGEGVSLYVAAGSSVQYRNYRVFGSRGRRRSRGFGYVKGNAGISFGNGVAKTARVASATSPTATIDYSVPSALWNELVSFDVRHFLQDVENESSGPVTLSLNSAGTAGSPILATAAVISQLQEAGGVVQLAIAVVPSASGVQPNLVRARATAGPSSPADATASYYPGLALVLINTPPLLDSGPYTYEITLENGATVAIAVTGLSVQADATGPPVPTFVTAAAS